MDGGGVEEAAGPAAGAAGEGQEGEGEGGAGGEGQAEGQAAQNPLMGVHPHRKLSTPKYRPHFTGGAAGMPAAAGSLLAEREGGGRRAGHAQEGKQTVCCPSAGTVRAGRDRLAHAARFVWPLPCVLRSS